MANRPGPADADSGHGPSSGPPRMPRWVKLSALVVAIILLLVVIAMLTGVGGDHGPGRHTGSGSPTSAAAPTLGHPAGG
ncbi:hypothetical protein OG394_18260 [Kribbella sp. NBC_01245]|uniref:hypothetical protein n=1 Tax=Kribbella sp. NBC_01245 TaxID=2903578 RepID=UPI002E286793|nr:hypothetical protein [Kribbella sp. NBC_01245]